jgi:malate synthase
MKLIKSLKKRKEAKVNAKIKREYEKFYLSKIEKVEKDFEEVVSKLNKKHENKVKGIDDHYKKEIEEIRAQEQGRWQPLLFERDQKIKELRDYIDDGVKHLEALREREFGFNDCVGESMATFERAFEKIKDGVQLMLSGQAKIDDFLRSVNKVDSKISGLVKER